MKGVFRYFQFIIALEVKVIARELFLIIQYFMCRKYICIYNSQGKWAFQVSFARCFEKVITGRRSKTKRMAAKPSTTTTAKATYSPIDPTRKTRPPIFSGSDVDWLRPDSRGFHQCRPACKLTLFSILLISLFFFWVSFLSSLLSKIGTCVTFDQALNVGPFFPPY